MSGSFTNLGDGNVELTFTYTAELEKVQNVINNTVQFLYNHPGGQAYRQYDGGVLIPFDSLTNQQKVDIVDSFVRSSILQKSRRNIIEQSIEAAREIAEADDSISLG
jgi:hypothetical protein